MTALNKFLAIAALLMTCIAGTRVYDAYATSTPQPSYAKYTPLAQKILHAHTCTEDDYMFIPSNYVNPEVTYRTPYRAYCIPIELLDNLTYAKGR